MIWVKQKKETPDTIPPKSFDQGLTALEPKRCPNPKCINMVAQGTTFFLSVVRNQESRLP